MPHKFNGPTGALFASLLLTLPAFGQATLVGNVHGYTLSGDHLLQFTGLVFDAGKVIETGDATALRGKFAGAAYIDIETAVRRGNLDIPRARAKPGI